MGQQMGTVLVPSASDVLLRFVGGQLSCAVLFELVSSTCPVNPEGMGSWSKSGGEKRGSTNSSTHDRRGTLVSSRQHTIHSTFTQHITPAHLPGVLLQGQIQSCLPVHPQCALSQSGPRHPTGSSRSHCYHAPTSSSASPGICSYRH